MVSFLVFAGYLIITAYWWVKRSSRRRLALLVGASFVVAVLGYPADVAIMGITVALRFIWREYAGR